MSKLQYTLDSRGKNFPNIIDIDIIQHVDILYLFFSHRFPNMCLFGFSLFVPKLWNVSLRELFLGYSNCVSFICSFQMIPEPLAHVLTGFGVNAMPRGPACSRHHSRQTLYWRPSSLSLFCKASKQSCCLSHTHVVFEAFTYVSDQSDWLLLGYMYPSTKITVKSKKLLV